MKTLILTILLLLPISANAWERKPENRWTWGDTIREAAYLQLTVMDWGQTRYIARSLVYKESNRLLGENPTKEEVDRFFVVNILLHGAVSYALPRRWREGWQYVTIGVRFNTVQHNHSIGVKIEF